MNAVLRDAQFALRQLRKNIGFTLVTVLTLALGIGATTSIFCLVNTVLLKPLPFSEPERLVAVGFGYQASPGQPVRFGSWSYPDYFDVRAQNHTLENIASYRDTSVTVLDSQGAHHFNAQIISANLFRVLRVNPSLGRDFNWDDEKPQSNVVMLSNEGWKSHFGGAPDIVGRAITLNRSLFTVVGVMPAGFTFPFQNPPPSMWVPLALDAYDPLGDPSTNQRGAHSFSTIGRLKAGVSTKEAEADISLIAKNLSLEYPDTNLKHPAAMVSPLPERLVGNSRAALRLLFGAVAFLLLIACANVAGLLLARSAQRRAEVAIRTALGASRYQIIRQVLVESLVLSTLGGALGITLSKLSLRTLIAIVPTELPRLGMVDFDSRVTIFAIGASVLTGILFGVLPAWRMSRLQPAQSIRQGSRTVTADKTQHRLQNTLIIAETAVGVILLVGSGLLIHTFVRVLNVNPGFDPHNVLIAELGLSDSRYDGTKMPQFYDELLNRVRTIPGVETVAASYPLPMSNNVIRISFEIEGRPVMKGTEPAENVGIVTPDYFKVLRIPMVRGRTFNNRDVAKAQPVMIVTQKFADRYFPNEDPIGKRIKPGLSDGFTKDVDREIVGVVGDIKLHGLTYESDPQYYLPYGQAMLGAIPLTIRTTGDPNSIVTQLRSIAASMDSTAPLYDIHTVDENLSKSAAQSKFQAILLTSFAGVALILFAVGLYGLLSYTVAQRTTEIGIRMALGARREDMLQMFLKQGLKLTVLGGVIGVCAAAGLTRFIASMLYGVSATDPSSFVTVSAVLVIVALGASFVPARRAMAVDPMTALKDE
jgi:predicted permease